MACSILAAGLRTNKAARRFHSVFAKNVGFSRLCSRPFWFPNRGFHASRSVCEETQDEVRAQMQLREQLRARFRAQKNGEDQAPIESMDAESRFQEIDPNETKRVELQPVSIDKISGRLREEIESFKDHIEISEEVRSQAKLLHVMLSVIAEVKAQRQAAESLGKNIEDLTAIDFAQWRLEQQQNVAKNIDMSSTPLYSINESFRQYNEALEVIGDLYPPHERLPNWLADALESMANNYMTKKMNEKIRALRVSDRVYQEVKKNLFPDLLERGVTAAEYVDYLGKDRVLTPLSLQVRDLVLKWIDAPTDQKCGLIDQVKEIIQDAHTDKDEDDLPEIGDKETQEKRKRACESISLKLGRTVKDADFCIERRLSFNGTNSDHPLLSKSPKYYIHGHVSNWESLSEQIKENKVGTVEWQKLDHFNPPTQYRPLADSVLKANVKLHEDLQIAALNFPMWESKSRQPANASELFICLKLWKLFTYAYPKLSHDEAAQREFMEAFDVSPGECTLEWTLSYPPKEHTFYPEHPLWIHPYEDDEDEIAIIWPSYEPVSLYGETNVTLLSNANAKEESGHHSAVGSSDASKVGDHSTSSHNPEIGPIRMLVRKALEMIKDPENRYINCSSSEIRHVFLDLVSPHKHHGHGQPERYLITSVQDQEQDEKCEAIYHAAWKRLSEDQKNRFTVEEAYRVLNSFTPEDIAEAEKYWKSLSQEQKKQARSEWNDSKFDDDVDRSRGAEEVKEFLNKV